MTTADHQSRHRRQRDPEQPVGSGEPQCDEDVSVPEFELVSQRENLEPQGSLLAERHAQWPDQRDDDGSPTSATVSADTGKIDVSNRNRTLGRN